ERDRGSPAGCGVRRWKSAAHARRWPSRAAVQERPFAKSAGRGCLAGDRCARALPPPFTSTRRYTIPCRSARQKPELLGQSSYPKSWWPGGHKISGNRILPVVATAAGRGFISANLGDVTKLINLHMI